MPTSMLLQRLHIWRGRSRVPQYEAQEVEIYRAGKHEHTNRIGLPASGSGHQDTARLLQSQEHASALGYDGQKQRPEITPAHFSKLSSIHRKASTEQHNGRSEVLLSSIFLFLRKQQGCGAGSFFLFIGYALHCLPCARRRPGLASAAAHPPSGWLAGPAAHGPPVCTESQAAWGQHLPQM